MLKKITTFLYCVYDFCFVLLILVNTNLTMKKPAKENKVQEQDFIGKYEEIMRIVKRDMASVEKAWQSNGEHIKKFTLLQEPPYTIQSDNTNCLTS